MKQWIISLLLAAAAATTASAEVRVSGGELRVGSQAAAASGSAVISGGRMELLPEGLVTLNVPLALDAIPEDLTVRNGSGEIYELKRYWLNCTLSIDGTAVAVKDMAVEAGTYTKTLVFNEEDLSGEERLQVNGYACRIDMMGWKRGGSAIEFARFHAEDGENGAGYAQSAMVESAEPTASGPIE